MGSEQSKQEVQDGRLRLTEQLRQMRLKMEADELERLARKQEDGEYVYVSSGDEDGGDEKGYVPTATELSVEAAEEWQKKLLEDPKNLLALNAFTTTSPATILTSRTSLITSPQLFNIRIPLEGAPMTNQRSSGRCWLFASTNVFRIAMMRRYNLAEFELSQSYLFFWDKLEKANFFLEQILDTANLDLSGRVVQTLLQGAVSDGGQWDMVANLVEKYGLVPQSLYPDSWNAMNSGLINQLIKTKLREDALILRKLASKSSLSASAKKRSIAAYKEEMMREIHLILTLTLGPPPSPQKEFVWEFYDKDGKYNSVKATPLGFAKELSSAESVRACAGTDVHKLFSLVNDPRNAYGELLTVERLGNIVGGRGVRYVNVDMDTIRTAAITMLRRGLPVFFGSDVGKYLSTTAGIMNLSLIDYPLGFNISLSMTKSQRLQTGESQMTHAMVLTGVHLDEEGKPVRWRVQNSWGTDAGKEGWFVATDGWMAEFCYQVVVDPTCVAKEIRDVLGKEPVTLPLWDPMGSLA